MFSQVSVGERAKSWAARLVRACPVRTFRLAIVGLRIRTMACTRTRSSRLQGKRTQSGFRCTKPWHLPRVAPPSSTTITQGCAGGTTWKSRNGCPNCRAAPMPGTGNARATGRSSSLIPIPKLNIKSRISRNAGVRAESCCEANPSHGSQRPSTPKSCLLLCRLLWRNRVQWTKT